MLTKTQTSLKNLENSLIILQRASENPRLLVEKLEEHINLVKYCTKQVLTNASHDIMALGIDTKLAQQLEVDF